MNLDSKIAVSTDAGKRMALTGGIEGELDLHVAGLPKGMTPDMVGPQKELPFVTNTKTMFGLKIKRKVDSGGEGLVNVLGVGGIPGHRGHNRGDQRQQSGNPKQFMVFHGSVKWAPAGQAEGTPLTVAGR